MKASDKKYFKPMPDKENTTFIPKLDPRYNKPKSIPELEAAKREVTRISLPPKPDPKKIAEMNKRLDAFDVKTLQSKMDDLQTKLWDLEEKNTEASEQHLRDEFERIGLKCHSDQVKKDLEKARTELCAASEKNNDLENQLFKLSQTFQATENNRKYACDHIYKQDALMRDAKAIIEKQEEEIIQLRTDNVSLAEHKVNAEHLARKSIQLNDEVIKLKGWVGTFEIEKHELTTNVSKLHSKISSDYDCEAREQGTLCGGCLSCLLKQAQHHADTLQVRNEKLTQENENLAANDTAEYLKLEQFLRDSIKDAQEKQKTIDTQKKTIQILNEQLKDYNNYIFDFKHCISIMTSALAIIAKGSFFGHKKIALKAAQDCDSYLRIFNKDYPNIINNSCDSNFCNCDKPQLNEMVGSINFDPNHSPTCLTGSYVSGACNFLGK